MTSAPAVAAPPKGPPEPSPEELAQRAEQRVSQELVPLKAGESELTLQPGQSWWTKRQLDTLRAQWKRDEQPRDEDLMVFLHLCLASGLDPFLREIYYIGRKDSTSPSGRKWTAQTGIDGFRHIAERTNEYAGRTPAEWCGPDGEWKHVWLDPDNPPVAARIAIKRRGMDYPFYGIAHYTEFVPLREIWEGRDNNRRRKLVDGKPVTEPMGLWPKMPAHMLAKCAEAQAVRAAFPRQAAGLYVTEEMHQADAREANELRARQRDALAERSWARNTGVELGKDQVTIVDAEVVPTPPRGELLEELANQAHIMGKNLRQWCTRWIAAHHKNLEDATDDELWELAKSRRDLVAPKAAEQNVEPYLAGAKQADAEPEQAQDKPAAAPEGDATPEGGSGDVSAAECGECGLVGKHDEECSSKGAPIPAVSDDTSGINEPVVEDPPVEVAGQEALLPEAPVVTAERHPFYGGDNGESDTCLETGCGQYADAEIHQP